MGDPSNNHNIDGAMVFDGTAIPNFQQVPLGAPLGAGPLSPMGAPLGTFLIRNANDYSVRLILKPCIGRGHFRAKQLSQTGVGMNGFANSIPPFVTFNNGWPETPAKKAKKAKKTKKEKKEKKKKKKDKKRRKEDGAASSPGNSVRSTEKMEATPTEAAGAGLKQFLKQHGEDAFSANMALPKQRPKQAAVFSVVNGKLTNILQTGEVGQSLEEFQVVWPQSVQVQNSNQPVMISLTGIKQPDGHIQSYCQWLDRKIGELIESRQMQPLQIVGHSAYFYDAFVDFSNNQMGDYAFRSLVDVLLKYRVRPLKLLLYKNQLTDHSVASLCELLVGLSPAAIPEMHLSHNRITADGCVSLVAMFKALNQYPIRISETQRHPVWVRMENNPIPEHKLILQVLDQLDITFCLAEERLNCGVNKCCHAQGEDCPLVHLPMFNNLPSLTVQNPADRVCQLLRTAVSAINGLDAIVQNIPPPHFQPEVPPPAQGQDLFMQNLHNFMHNNNMPAQPFPPDAGGMNMGQGPQGHWQPPMPSCPPPDHGCRI